jgi:NADPH:quinone reductase-like Zn-dependent oxidoreductase
MQAMLCTRYGPPDVFQMRDLEKPVPQDHEVLIRVQAAAVTVSDCFVRSGKINIFLWLPMRIYVGFQRPRRSVLGLELSGQIEAVGNNVKRFRPGDQIMAFTGKHFGAYAEYACLPEDGLYFPADPVMAMKPRSWSYPEAAAMVTRGALAWHFIEQAHIQKGQKVLVYGASGGVGTLAVQLAKHFGAEVTGVCSAANRDMVKALGADEVRDYQKEDVFNDGRRYHFIFDAVGKRFISKHRGRKALVPGGKYSSVDESAKINLAEFTAFIELAEKEKIKPVIDRCYPLEQLGAAQAYVETMHKKGHVVIASS